MSFLQKWWLAILRGCTRRVGVTAFSGSVRGLNLVPLKWRSLVPPTADMRVGTRDKHQLTSRAGFCYSSEDVLRDIRLLCTRWLYKVIYKDGLLNRGWRAPSKCGRHK